MGKEEEEEGQGGGVAPESTQVIRKGALFEYAGRRKSPK